MTLVGGEAYCCCEREGGLVVEGGEDLGKGKQDGLVLVLSRRY